MRQRRPGVLAARGAPALDRLEDRFRPLAAKRPIDVDDEQRRPLAETGPRAEPAGGEDRLVALGEKFVPNPLAHRRLLVMRPVRREDAAMRCGRQAAVLS